MGRNISDAFGRHQWPHRASRGRPAFVRGLALSFLISSGSLAFSSSFFFSICLTSFSDRYHTRARGRMPRGARTASRSISTEEQRFAECGPRLLCPSPPPFLRWGKKHVGWVSFSPFGRCGCAPFYGGCVGIMCCHRVQGGQATGCHVLIHRAGWHGFVDRYGHTDSVYGGTCTRAHGRAVAIRGCSDRQCQWPIASLEDFPASPVPLPSPYVRVDSWVPVLPSGLVCRQFLAPSGRAEFAREATGRDFPQHAGLAEPQLLQKMW